MLIKLNMFVSLRCKNDCQTSVGKVLKETSSYVYNHVPEIETCRQVLATKMCLNLQESSSSNNEDD